MKNNVEIFEFQRNDNDLNYSHKPFEIVDEASLRTPS